MNKAAGFGKIIIVNMIVKNKEGKMVKFGSEFVGQYSLSKTLRFELKPIGKTAETFEKWIDEICKENFEDEIANFFYKDVKLRDSYLALKPIFDKIHENFITESLQCDAAKGIDFSIYFAEKQRKKSEGNSKAVKDNLSEIEKNLRKSIGDLFSRKMSDKPWVTYDKKGNPKFVKNKSDFAGLLQFVLDKADSFASDDISSETIKKHCENIKGFTGYFDKYMENRINYYVINKEQNTAVATRIVSELLPVFYNNRKRYLDKQEEFDALYSSLKDRNIECRYKDKITGEYFDIECFDVSVYDEKYFNYCLTQQEIEKYNAVIGRNNELLNLYNQQIKGKNAKLNGFESLHKQIGCKGQKRYQDIELLHDRERDRKDNSAAILSIEGLLKEVKKKGDRYLCESDNVVTIYSIINWLKSSDNWEGIYINDKALNEISNRYFVNWSELRETLKENKAIAKYDIKEDLPLKINKAVELSEIFYFLNSKSVRFKDEYQKLDDGASVGKYLINLVCADIETCITQFFSLYEQGFDDEDEHNHLPLIQAIIDNQTDGGLYKEDLTLDAINKWIGSACDIVRKCKYFVVGKNKIKGNAPNSSFYNMLNELMDSDFADFIKCYDKARNYLTRQPQDDVKGCKLKLNFGSSSLLKGWDLNKEKDNLGVILRKDGYYYLAIIDKENKDIFAANNFIGGDYYEKMKFKEIALSAGIGGFVRKCVKTAEGLGWKCPDECLNEDGKIIIRDEEVNENLPQIIDCYKDFFDKYEKDGFKYRDYQFHFEDSCSYCTLKDFFNDVASQACIKDFRNISSSFIDECVDAGKLYLFRIWSKDSRTGAHGKKDLQQLYWEDIFRDDSPHRIAANAEIFWRKPIDGKAFVHKEGSILVNKKDVDGETIPGSIYKEIFEYVNDSIKKDKLSAEARKYLDEGKIVHKPAKFTLIKDKRFYDGNKYFFHCPLVLNYTAKGANLDNTVNDVIATNDNITFIGIDRGEKNLVYSCEVDIDGNIVNGNCKHYNTINGTDYLKKLEDVAVQRTEARKNWHKQAKIKDLKRGYISHVVHLLASNIVNKTEVDGKTILSPHSLVVFEKLTKEMKRGRQKIEKQTYQNLELALAKKLAFLVDKDVSEGVGTVNQPLQLVPEIKTYDRDIDGKNQIGIMLYTRAQYTSVTDPLTGWRKTIYISGIVGEIMEQIYNKFTDICFDGKDYFFEYKEENVGHIWRLYSGKDGISLPRYIWNRTKNENEQYDVKAKLDILFKNFDKSKSLLQQLKDGVKLCSDQNSKRTAVEELRYAIDMIQNIRNDGKNAKDKNMLYSPVRDAQGRHFDTRNASAFSGLETIVDADANGAFNIARKGAIMSQHIAEWVQAGRPKSKLKNEKKEKSDLNLLIRDGEWDMWLLDREQWKKNLQIFSSRKKMFEDE